jgi:hypothetical protein
MSRITKDDREYCLGNKKCLDCYAENKDIEATDFHPREKWEVPCCRKHFNEYRSKMSQLNHRNYERRSQTKQKLEICIYPGCHNKLIPRELIPAGMRDRSCGLHGTFRAFQLNRMAMKQVVIDHCLTAEERKDMNLRSIIYETGEPLAFIGVQHPAYYQTQIWPASDLQFQHNETHLK